MSLRFHAGYFAENDMNQAHYRLTYRAPVLIESGFDLICTSPFPTPEQVEGFLTIPDEVPDEGLSDYALDYLALWYPTEPDEIRLHITRAV